PRTGRQQHRGDQGHARQDVPAHFDGPRRARALPQLAAEVVTSARPPTPPGAIDDDRPGGGSYGWARRTCRSSTYCPQADLKVRLYVPSPGGPEGPPLRRSGCYTPSLIDRGQSR